jgi:ABC-type spermidine/putrescine transport system permease subunit II
MDHPVKVPAYTRAAARLPGGWCWSAPLRNQVALPGVEAAKEDGMDLWSALGISPQVGLLAAAAGLATAIAFARALALRRARVEKRGLDLREER